MFIYFFLYFEHCEQWYCAACYSIFSLCPSSASRSCLNGCLLKPGSRGANNFFKLSPLGLYLSDCTNMMIMSHCGISVVINVRLYDSQDALRKKKTCPEFYIINPYTFSDWELRCTRDRSVGCHEKYMSGVFKKNSVCNSTHPHDNSGTTSVCMEKATYQMNSVSQFMADRIIL